MPISAPMSRTPALGSSSSAAIRPTTRGSVGSEIGGGVWSGDEAFKRALGDARPEHDREGAGSKAEGLSTRGGKGLDAPEPISKRLPGEARGDAEGRTVRGPRPPC